MESRYYIYVPKSVIKSMRKIPLQWVGRIKRAIDGLELDPNLGDKMSGDRKDKRKIRVWPYRIIYRVNESTRLIEIVEVERKGNMSYD